MANQYDTNLKLQAIADAIGDSGSSGLISALEDIADAVAGGGGGGSSTAGLVSDNFSETDTYDLGDYCIHNNTLYVCINAITTPGPWDLSDWQATNTGLELSSLNSALVTKADASALPDLKVYQLTANMSAHQGNGNFKVLNMPSNVVPVCIAPWNATDCDWTLFYSSTAHAWFAHASKFADGSAETSATITTMYIYYVKYST